MWTISSFFKVGLQILYSKLFSISYNINLNCKILQTLYFNQMICILAQYRYWTYLIKLLYRTLSTLELRHIMTNLGEKLKDSEIDEMILHSDTDGDGVIHCNEWVNLMTSLWTKRKLWNQMLPFLRLISSSWKLTFGNESFMTCFSMQLIKVQPIYI